MAYLPNRVEIKNSGLTFSLVVETENLGMAGIDDLRDTLDSLKCQSYPVASAQEVLLLAAGHVSDETLSSLYEQYPWVRVHKEIHPMEYLESKKRGAELATGDIVVFADSDVVYESTWLEQILYGFVAAPGAAIVAGDTRIRGSSVYAIAIQLIWMMSTEVVAKYPHLIRHFDLNNFAIKRSIMLKASIFSGLPLYRAHTVEMKKQLYSKGYSAVRVPGARGYHLPPGTLSDWWYRLLVYGADAVAKADFYFEYGGTVRVRYSLIRRLFRIPLFFGWKCVVMFTRIYVLVREDWRRIGKLFFAMPIVFASLCVMLVGACISLVDRKYIFNRISAREHEHVV